MYLTVKTVVVEKFDLESRYNSILKTVLVFVVSHDCHSNVRVIKDFLYLHGLA